MLRNRPVQRLLNRHRSLDQPRFSLQIRHCFLLPGSSELAHVWLWRRCWARRRDNPGDNLLAAQSLAARAPEKSLVRIPTAPDRRRRYPLLQDGVRVLTRMQRASTALGDKPGRIRNRMRSVMRGVLTIGYQARSPKTRDALVRSYRKLMVATRAVPRDADTMVRRLSQRRRTPLRRPRRRANPRARAWGEHAGPG